MRNNLDAHLRLPAKTFSKADLRGVRDQIHRRAPQQASRFLSYLGPVMRWAAQEDLVETNIVPDVLKIAGINKRERTLTHDEIAAIWHATFKLDKGDSSRAFGRLVRFLLLSVQRRSEGTALKYGHLLDGTWRQKHNKAERPQRLKLPQQALDQIGSGEPTEFVFTGMQGKEISGFSKLKPELDRLSGVQNWRLHDLRRTGASEMQELGIDRMVIEAVLNHAIAGGAAAHYLHAMLDRAKADALQAWADHVDKIVTAKTRAVS